MGMEVSAKENGILFAFMIYVLKDQDFSVINYTEVGEFHLQVNKTKDRTILRHRPCRDDDEIMQTIRSSVIRSNSYESSKYAADFICLEDDFDVRSDEFIATIVMDDIAKLKEEYNTVGIQAYM